MNLKFQYPTFLIEASKIARKWADEPLQNLIVSEFEILQKGILFEVLASLQQPDELRIRIPRIKNNEHI